jgi:hypothetical protein
MMDSWFMRTLTRAAERLDAMRAPVRPYLKQLEAQIMRAARLFESHQILNPNAPTKGEN